MEKLSQVTEIENDDLRDELVCIKMYYFIVFNLWYGLFNFVYCNCLEFVGYIFMYMSKVQVILSKSPYFCNLLV